MINSRENVKDEADLTTYSLTKGHKKGTNSVESVRVLFSRIDYDNCVDHCRFDVEGLEVRALDEVRVSYCSEEEEEGLHHRHRRTWLSTSGSNR